ncbi:hypothetical protein B0J13DRAFT_253711 [Dactylonectria estremocensis]|uniref:Secreted protein n=1 Tax=Dactylonectria estremocensis TaxID=1079267 RepID=A0A9P9F376_9HYPO|nr:hypothetical protein B0J13DRAFT_253711 [Dactylonectria estremocensis]
MVMPPVFCHPRLLFLLSPICSSLVAGLRAGCRYCLRRQYLMTWLTLHHHHQLQHPLPISQPTSTTPGLLPPLPFSCHLFLSGLCALFPF